MRFQFVHIGKSPEMKYPRMIRAGNGDRRRRGAGGKDQFVISFTDLTAGDKITQDDFLIDPVDGYRFAAGADIHAEACIEFFRSHDEQIIPVRDDVSQMVRQPAVCVRDGLPAFHKNDFRLFVQPAQTRRRACSPCDSADDDYFHKQ